MFIGIMLGAGAVFVLWALHRAVAYATPLAIGIAVAVHAYSFGATLIAAAALGPACAFGSFALLRFITLRTTSTPVRCALATAYALPATALAYGIAIELMRQNLSAPMWSQTIAIGFATLAGIISFKRLVEFEPGPQ